MGSSTIKEMRLLVRQAVRSGCIAEKRRSSHTRIWAPNGAWMDVSFSPGSANNVRFAQRKVAKFIAANC